MAFEVSGHGKPGLIQIAGIANSFLPSLPVSSRLLHMASSSDYYQTLGVASSATQDEIRKAYKKLARENHPDTKPGDQAAAERFKQASEAYEVLGDEEKRKQYDQYGDAYKYAKSGGNPFGGGAGGSGPIDLESVFGQGGVDFGDIFGGVFGGRGGGAAGGRRKAAATRGEDLQTSILIPFQMAATGGKYDVTINRGSSVDTLEVKVPAGILHGGTIRLSKQGSPGAGGGPAGDLMITVQIAPHPYFRREGSDVILECPLSVTEAILGTRIDVPTLSEGPFTLTIPPGTSSGAKLRMRGQGFPNLKTGTPGDQYVIARIMVPKTVDAATSKLLTQLADQLPPVDRSEWK